MIDILGITLSQLPPRRTLVTMVDDCFLMAWKERHRSVRDEKAACASLAGLLLLQAAGIRGTLAYDDTGRPYLNDREVDFNITHTDRHAFCAIEYPPTETVMPEPPPSRDYPSKRVSKVNIKRMFAGQCRVGLDAENLSRLASMRICPLADRWFSLHEEDFFLSAPTDETFLRVWTRKEALVKWLGGGLTQLRQADTVTAQSLYRVRFHEYRVENTVVSLCCHETSPAPHRIHMLTDTEFSLLV